MASSTNPDLFVVDGSNIATEGRSNPSLEQLNEAVLAFMAQYPDAQVTVVVDATFGHRIDKKEASAFDEAVANNELVTPPAGAIGRGDAFVLSIADTAGAGILSNDSFQEFHGEYDWLFDEGRLIGGKPVPHVGWVFVERNPVRGPKSRRSVRQAKKDSGEAKSSKDQANRRVRKKSAAADDGDAPPKGDDADGPKSGRRSRRGRGRKKAAETNPEQERTIADAKAASPPAKDQVNELMPFLEFVERHPVGTSCTGVVESYASHGAYARIDDVLIYIPLRFMDDPPPRSARSVLEIGEAVALVIVGYVPDRRSIDASLPHHAAAVEAKEESSGDGQEPGAPGSDDATSGAPGEAVTAERPAAKRTSGRKKAAAKQAATTERAADEPAAAGDVDQARRGSDETADDRAPAKKSAAKKAAAKKRAAKKSTAARTAAAKKTPAKRSTTAKQTSTETSPTKKSVAKKAAAKKTAATTSATKKASAKKAAAKKTTAEKSTAKKTPAKRTAAKKTAAKKSAAKKAPAKRTAAKKTAAKTSAANKSGAKKAPAKRSAAKKTSAKTSTARRRASKQPAEDDG